MHIGSQEVDFLRSGRKFVLTTHVSSDGDGVGSQLALARGLRQLGCDVVIINPTPVPENLRFLLKRSSEIQSVREMESPERYFTGALTVVLDIGAFERLGDLLPLARLSEGILVVDHHRMDRTSGVHYLLDTQACATGEVTARILEELTIPLTLDLAEPLYVAIHTDTGGFRYPGTTPETHRLIARLLEAGVDPQKVYTELFERLTPLRLWLTSEVLSTVRISPGGKVAWLQIRQAVLQKYGARMEDADDMVNFTLELDGVLAGFYFKELGEGLTKVSCRSRGDFAIDKFVSPWGGGGHQHAAGVKLNLPIEEATKMLVSAATDVLEKKG